MSKNKMICALTIFFRLVKFPLSLMVAFSALTGYLISHSVLSESMTLLTGVFLLACSANGFNQVQEHNFDILMERTKNRPIPSGQISVSEAFGISTLLLISGAFFLGLAGWLPLLLGLLNMALYNLLYTPLKRKTWLAVIPGSIIGAINPMIGWTSGDMPLFHPVIIFVCLFVLLWQFPHFWLIIIRYGKDYKKAGFRILPDSLTENQVKNLLFCWMLLTSAWLFTFPFFSFKLSVSLILILIMLNLLFITLFYRFLFYGQRTESLRRTFILINSFAVVVLLFMIFAV